MPMPDFQSPKPSGEEVPPSHSLKPDNVGSASQLARALARSYAIAAKMLTRWQTETSPAVGPHGIDQGLGLGLGARPFMPLIEWNVPSSHRGPAVATISVPVISIVASASPASRT